VPRLRGPHGAPSAQRVWENTTAPCARRAENAGVLIMLDTDPSMAIMPLIDGLKEWPGVIDLMALCVK
jgi:hypothetical protein